MRKKRIIGIIIFSLVGLLVIVGVHFTEGTEPIQGMIGDIIAFIGAVAVFFELAKTSSLTEGEFIKNIEAEYSTHEEFVRLYSACWEEYNNVKDETYKFEDNKDSIIAYLTFFESIYVMYKNRAISIELIDDLFARRFFAVVNNKKIQEMELNKDDNYKYYMNIYKLHSIWMDYRDKKTRRMRKIDFDYKDPLLYKEHEGYRNLQKCLEAKVQSRELMRKLLK